jgi:NAD(P)-dependent dehydrogenase (short-subunit alcohol dehydrogenase family)
MPAWNSFTKTWHTKAYPSISPTNPSLSARGKIVLITGGSRGIGKSIAIGFAQASASIIIITGRSKTSMTSAAAEIKSQSPLPSMKVETFEADILDPLAMKYIFETVKKDFGPIDILISNAGYLNTPSSISSSPLSDYWSTFKINVKGSIIVAQEFLRSKAGSQKTTFISINSGAAHISYIPDFSAYAASKIATLRVMEYLSNEERGMRVFSVQPGTVDTDMQRKAGRDAQDDISMYRLVVSMRGSRGLLMVVDLPAGFCVWLAACKDADFLRGRLVWANWDVDELLARKEEVIEKDLLNVRLLGLGD